MSGIELCNIVTYNPSTVHVDDSLDSLCDRLQREQHHHWPVVDDDRQLVGVISESDITKAVTRPAAVVASVGAGQAEGLPRGRTAGAIMSRDVCTVEEGETVELALATMLARNVRCLPVLNEGRLVAILTTADLLREMSFAELPVSREAVNEHLVNCLDFVEPETPLHEAEALLETEKLEYLPVMQGSCPVGLLTRRRVRLAKYKQALARLADDGPLEETTGSTEAVMGVIEKLAALRPGQRLSAAAGAMMEQGTRAIPVVNQAKRLLGVVTEELLLRLMLADLEDG